MMSIKVGEICKVRNSALHRDTTTKGYSFAYINRVNRKSVNIKFYPYCFISDILNVDRKAVYATVAFSDLWKLKRATRIAIARHDKQRKLTKSVAVPNSSKQPDGQPEVDKPGLFMPDDWHLMPPTDIAYDWKHSVVLSFEQLQSGLGVVSEPILFKVKHSNTIIKFVMDSVTKFSGNAIVYAANEGCLGGGGVDYMINNLGGEDLFQARKALPIIYDGKRCAVGDAKITIAGNLPCDYVIHAVGPNFNICDSHEQGCRLLDNAYKNSLLRAKEKNLKNVAFCLLSAGIFRGSCPLKTIIEVALTAISKYSYPGLEHIYLCAFTSEEQNVLRQIVDNRVYNFQ